MLHVVQAVENEEPSKNRAAEHEQPSHTASGCKQLHPLFRTGGMGWTGGAGWAGWAGKAGRAGWAGTSCPSCPSRPTHAVASAPSMCAVWWRQCQAYIATASSTVTRPDSLCV